MSLISYMIEQYIQAYEAEGYNRNAIDSIAVSPEDLIEAGHKLRGPLTYRDDYGAYPIDANRAVRRGQVVLCLTDGHAWPANTRYCTHEFPDTGMRKSWCKHCDVVGNFDPTTAHFLATE
jgi:hypothetical protein